MYKYFCENLVLNKEALRMAYICKKTNKVCPRVRYGARGEASPDVLYKLRGCEYNKKEETVENKNIKKQEEAIVNEIKEETTQPAEQTVVKENTAPIQKQNNYKKKNKQYNKQNQVKNK